MKEELPASGNWWKLENGDICPECNGERLNPVSRKIILKGKKNMSLPELLSLTPDEIISFLESLILKPREKTIASAIIPEVIMRLKFMKNVGLDYLSLDRETSSFLGRSSKN